LFNINNGPIYIWAVAPGFTFPTANAIALSGTQVPQQVGQILYDTYSGILMAFGATPYGASSPYTIEPLLVRWASQDDYTNWDPSTPHLLLLGFSQSKPAQPSFAQFPTLVKSLYSRNGQ
jgi:hypothetical protein